MDFGFLTFWSGRSCKRLGPRRTVINSSANEYVKERFWEQPSETEFLRSLDTLKQPLLQEMSSCSGNNTTQKRSVPRILPTVECRCIRTCRPTGGCCLHTHRHTHTKKGMYIYIHIYICIHTYIYTHIYIYIHTYLYIYKKA